MCDKVLDLLIYALVVVIVDVRLVHRGGQGRTGDHGEEDRILIFVVTLRELVGTVEFAVQEKLTGFLVQISYGPDRKSRLEIQLHVLNVFLDIDLIKLVQIVNVARDVVAGSDLIVLEHFRERIVSRLFKDLAHRKDLFRVGELRIIQMNEPGLKREASLNDRVNFLVGITAPLKNVSDASFLLVFFLVRVFSHVDVVVCLV